MDEAETEWVIDGKRGWKVTWRHVGWRARRRVKRAMWRGEAIDDPVLAALVVGLVRRTRAHMGGNRLDRALLDVPGVETDVRFAQLDNAEEQNLAVLARRSAADPDQQPPG